MAFDFGRLKSDIVNVGKEVGDKVSEVSTSAKIKLDIKNKENFIEKQFAELGKKYYLSHKDDTEPTELGDFAAIKEAYQEIDRLNDELLTNQGAVICPNCGKKQPQENVCCVNCGQNMKSQDM